MHGWEREIYTLSVRIPRPPVPTHSKKDERGNTVKDRKAMSRLYQQKNHWIALKTHESNTNRMHGQQDHSTETLRWE